MTPHGKKAAWALALVLAGAGVVYQFRWVIGGRAMTIADPIVRRWAAQEVVRLSEGAYHLSVAPMQVDLSAGRVAVDSIVLTTDSAGNSARPAPLPTLTARFLHCAVDGIDLDRLTRRRGFSAVRAGCDSLLLRVSVPPNVARDSTGGSFLSLQEDLDLARGVPFIHIDSVVMPHVVMAAALAPVSGRSTAIGFDHLAIRLDALHYDPSEPKAARQTLLSRNVSLAVDSLVTHREGRDQMELGLLRADLATGTVALSRLRWRPEDGEVRDSLGLTDLAIDTLSVSGMNWREFLTRGNIAVHRIGLGGARITLRSEGASAESRIDSAGTPWTLAASLRAINRGIRLDSMMVERFALDQLHGRDTTRTTVASLLVTAINAPPQPPLDRPHPIGPMTVALQRVQRSARDRLLDAQSIRLDLGEGVLAVDSLRLSPAGSDADFIRRQRRRRDRIAVSVASVRLAGLAGAAWVTQGAYRARSATISGLNADILTDKRLPASPPPRRRTPQRWMQEVAPPLAIDSLLLTGRAQYRERARTAPRAGVLRFEELSLRLTHLHNIPDSGTPASTVLDASARLMGVAPLSVHLELPLLDSLFSGSYRGRLGPMPAATLNSFLDGAAGARFTNGRIHEIGFEASIRNGTARGRVRPRYEGLWIELPGVARSGFLSGIKRAIVKFAANQFVVREDNMAGGTDPARDGSIQHRWQPRETLIQFLWNGLRDGLLSVVRK